VAAHALRARRAKIAAAHGAGPALVEEILAYTDKAIGETAPPRFPLADEPHVEAWLRYTADLPALGVLGALRKRFVQLRFPIREGISQEPAYLDATRRGRLDGAEAFDPGLELAAPDRLELHIHQTIAGRIPVVMAFDRRDFVALVQAFTERNEPVPVLPSMGACIVTGLNNWDRVRAYREQWEAQNPGLAQTGWGEEFRRLAARKELYQDRFIILSGGPYSGVRSADIGLDEGDWLRRSIAIRREHECTHYYTYRVFHSMKNHVFDELVADFVGLVMAFGSYRGDLARRFLGLERFPEHRAGGRLELYCGALSPDAVSVVAALAVSATRNLEVLSTRMPIADVAQLAALTYHLSVLTLEELASSDMPARIGATIT
jgi:hypothetical protein